MLVAEKGRVYTSMKCYTVTANTVSTSVGDVGKFYPTPPATVRPVVLYLSTDSTPPAARLL